MGTSAEQELYHSAVDAPEWQNVSSNTRPVLHALFLTNHCHLTAKFQISKFLTKANTANLQTNFSQFFYHQIS